MKKKVEIEFDIPDSITEEEFEEWFKFEVIAWSCTAQTNPLFDKEKENWITDFYIWS